MPFQLSLNLKIPCSKKLGRTKSASDLSVVTDGGSILAFNPPICDNRASISSKSSLLPSVKARAKLPLSYQKGFEQRQPACVSHKTRKLFGPRKAPENNFRCFSKRLSFLGPIKTYRFHKIFYK